MINKGYINLEVIMWQTSRIFKARRKRYACIVDIETFVNFLCCKCWHEYETEGYTAGVCNTLSRQRREKCYYMGCNKNRYCVVGMHMNPKEAMQQ
ncbi:hypothetical protein QE152_g33887 [Popillia japonica]|uniref:Uncharacterized protein n=1 Tax=Popillia japonica TaxID=7064 RepID=A0AAW1IVY3_POPJA